MYRHAVWHWTCRYLHTFSTKQTLINALETLQVGCHGKMMSQVLLFMVMLCVLLWSSTTIQQQNTRRTVQSWLTHQQLSFFTCDRSESFDRAIIISSVNLAIVVWVLALGCQIIFLIRFVFLFARELQALGFSGVDSSIDVPAVTSFHYISR